MQCTELKISAPFLKVFFEEVQDGRIYQYSPCLLAAAENSDGVNIQHWRFDLANNGVFNQPGHSSVAYNIIEMMLNSISKLIYLHTVSVDQCTILHQPAYSTRTNGTVRRDSSPESMYRYSCITPLGPEALEIQLGDRIIDCAVGKTLMFDSNERFAVSLSTENIWYMHMIVRVDDVTCGRQGLQLDLDDNTVSRPGAKGVLAVKKSQRKKK